MSILQSRRYQPLDADLTAVAVSGLAAAWTTYTPTITAGTGTFTTVVGSGRYLLIGKVLFLEITITITTNGTAGTSVIATLPTGLSSKANFVLIGRNAGAGGNVSLHGTIGAAGTTISIVKYDSTYPGVDGAIPIISGCLEIT